MPKQKHSPQPAAVKPAWGLADYVWFIVKNIFGWIFVLGAGPIGVVFPGPGGLPLFIIGFALITFPGKRRLTARVMRGIPVNRENRTYHLGVAAVALLAPTAVVLTILHGQWWSSADHHTLTTVLLVLTYLAFVVGIWAFGLLGVDTINLGLSLMPKVRRKVRPWMRRKGLDLLPPRRRLRLTHPEIPQDDEEILEIHESYRKGAHDTWALARPWLVRSLRIVFVAAIFWWMLRPIFKQWNDPANGPLIRQHIRATNWWLFALAALMFSLFLFVFRTTSWRWILRGFGHRLPIAPATRIWSFSELARYLPGVIWQVVGRVYLSRPYGVSASVSSASQVLELVLFMLANILVAMAGLLGAGVRRIPPEHRHWIFIAMAFVPAMLVLLHPKVFYGLLNRLMTRLKKAPIAQALGKRQLTALLAWNIAGLLWQSLALWVLTCSVLDLPLGKWYVLAGAYCLAWTMGFSVGFLSPGGIGVRELVFVTTLQSVLPPAWVQTHFPSPTVLAAVAGFLSVLLRMWAIAGELLMAGAAWLSDYRGAIGRPDAPGRAHMPAEMAEAE